MQRQLHSNVLFGIKEKTKFFSTYSFAIFVEQLTQPQK